MKRVLGVFYTAVSFVTVSAQGLVNFANTPSTLVTAQELTANGPYSVMSGAPGTYYFGLFFGSAANPTFSGIYATNTGVDGFLSGGTVAVPGWAPGTSTNFVIIGWSAFMGHTYSPNWLFDRTGDLGFANGTGVSGNGSSIPPFNIFDGVSGFQLSNTFVPEPSTAAIAIGSGAVTFLYRMRNKNKEMVRLRNVRKARQRA